MARQLVKSTVNLDLMMLAGEKQNSGAMIGALGNILGAALDKGNQAKEARTKADLAKMRERGEAERAERDKIDVAGRSATESLEGLNAKGRQGIFDPNFGKVEIGGQGMKGFVEVGQGEFGLVDDSGEGGLMKYNKAWDLMTIAQKNGYPGGKEEYVKEQESLPADQQAEKDAIEAYAKSKGVIYNEKNPVHVQGYLNSEFNVSKPGVTRLKDGSPFGRRQQSRSRPSFNQQGAQSFNQNVNAAGQEPVGTRDTSSQYTKGRTFVEKEQTIQMHSSLGQLGQAAAEGWNISVERDNYEKQVAADLKDFRNDEWTAAGEESDKNALFDRGFVDAMGSFKTAYGQAQLLTDPKKRAATLASIETKMGDIKRENAEVQELKKFYKENFDNINHNLVETDRTDSILSMFGGGEVGFVLDEAGNFTAAGQTKNGTPIRKSPADIRKLFANMPMKRDFYEEAFGISKALKDADYKIGVIGPDGIKTKQNVPLDQFQKEIAGQVEAVLFADGDKSGKGIASRMPAFQGKNGLRAWEAGMELPEYKLNEDGSEQRDENGERIPEERHPYNIMRKNLTEAIYNDMGGYAAEKDETVTSMYTNQQAEKSRIARENRQRSRARGDAQTTSDNYNEFLDNAFGAYGTEGIQMTSSNLEYLKGLPGVSDVQYTQPTYNSNKQMTSPGTLTLLDKSGEAVIDRIDMTDEETARNVVLNYMTEKKFNPAVKDTKTGGYSVPVNSNHDALTNKYAPKE